MDMQRSQSFVSSGEIILGSFPLKWLLSLILQAEGVLSVGLPLSGRDILLIFKLC